MAKSSSKRSPKWLRRIVFFLLLIIILIITFGIIKHEPRPKGHSPAAADSLAVKMMESVNCQAWENTAIVSWTFMGIHQHLWDKKRNLARVSWDEKVVWLDISSKKGLAEEAGKRLSYERAYPLFEQAWKFWVNDAFWLNPVCKVFDQGTVRQLATDNEDREGLLVTYNEGGATPGDSYLWLLDENNRPKAWKMWVSILPIGGLETTWEDWQELSTGAWVSGKHENMMDLEIGEIKAAGSVQEMFPDGDPFQILVDEGLAVPPENQTTADTLEKDVEMVSDTVTTPVDTVAVPADSTVSSPGDTTAMFPDSL